MDGQRSPGREWVELFDGWLSKCTQLGEAKIGSFILPIWMMWRRYHFIYSRAVSRHTELEGKRSSVWINPVSTYLVSSDHFTFFLLWGRCFIAGVRIEWVTCLMSPTKWSKSVDACIILAARVEGEIDRVITRTRANINAILPAWKLRVIND